MLFNFLSYRYAKAHYLILSHEKNIDYRLLHSTSFSTNKNHLQFL